MSSVKRVAIEKTARFIRVILNQEGKTQDPQHVKAEMESYLAYLTSLNQDASNEQTRPFLLISRESEDTLEESKAQKLILAAADKGLNDQFLQIAIGGQGMYFFSHKAKPFVDEYCTSEDVAFTNMESNALVFEDFNFIGVYSATPERCAAALIEAEQILTLG